MFAVVSLAAMLHFPEADGRDQRIQRTSYGISKQILHCKRISSINDTLHKVALGAT